MYSARVTKNTLEILTSNGIEIYSLPALGEALEIIKVPIKLKLDDSDVLEPYNGNIGRIDYTEWYRSEEDGE